MNRSKTNQQWESGDCFIIPLLDGQFLLCQVLSAEAAVLNSVSCALFNQKIATNTVDPSPDVGRLFSTVMTTRDLIDTGHWKIIGKCDISVSRTEFPFESLRASGFIGAKVIGSRNIEEFANAYCGLSPWDDWADPHYLDRLLISQKVKPTKLRYKASMSSATDVT